MFALLSTFTRFLAFMPISVIMLFLSSPAYAVTCPTDGNYVEICNFFVNFDVSDIITVLTAVFVLIVGVALFIWGGRRVVGLLGR